MPFLTCRIFQHAFFKGLVYNLGYNISADARGVMNLDDNGIAAARSFSHLYQKFLEVAAFCRFSQGPSLL